MAAYAILEVSTPSEAPGALWHAAIEEPRPGTEGDTFALEVAGSVIGRAAPAVAVEFTCEDDVVQTAELVAPRPELAGRYSGVPEDTPCGFRAFVGLLGLTPELELRLDAMLGDGSRVPIGSMNARRELLQSPFSPRLRPLLVTSPGRTGSTWLMRALAAHPQIVVHDDHPYEVWPGRYWAHALKVLTAPASQASPDASPYEVEDTDLPAAHTFDASAGQVGHNPFYRPRYLADNSELRTWLGREYVQQLAAFCQGATEQWYLSLARAQGRDQPAFFAEKHMHHPNRSPALMSGALSVRERGLPGAGLP